MGREKDRLWEYVEDLNGRFLCNFCGSCFSGGITRIKSHLSGVRGRDIEICQKVPEDVKKIALHGIQIPDKRAGSLRSANNDRGTEVVSTSAPKKKAKNSHQPNDAGVCNKDKCIAHKSLAKFIISNSLSFDVSETPFLVDLLKNVAEIGPSYELPSYSDLKSHWTPGVNKEIEEYTGNAKKLFAKTGCTLIMSKVEKNSKLECVNFFIYSPGGLVYVDKIRVPEEGMTFLYFTDNVCRIIESLGPEHVVQVILDDCKDCMVDCFTDFKEDDFFPEVMEKILRKYPRICLSRCANGELGELLQLVYNEVPWVHKTTQLAKLIFKYSYEHNITLLPRKEQHTRKKEYSHSGVNKISIELFIINSILEVKKDLQALQIPKAPVSYEGEGSSSENDVAAVVRKAIHSTEFWRRGKEVVQILQPLFQVLELIDGYGSTLGYLYEAMKRAEEVFKQHFVSDNRIRKMFIARRSRIVQPIHEVAGFLNPAYMHCWKFGPDTKMKKCLDTLTLLVPDVEQESLIKEVQLYRQRGSDLFTATAMKMLKTVHPRKWWECCGDSYPVLQKIAIRVLSQTCSTSLCDHIIFQQNALVDELSMNMIMMEKFSLLKSQNLELIDLDRISGLPVCDHHCVKTILEDLDWSDHIDFHDLLVINNSNDQISTPSIDQESELESELSVYFVDSESLWSYRNQISTPSIDQESPVVNRPPEKRQRVPSAYNRFIKDEIQRFKAGNPDISHGEAFSAAAKNWADFPHIHFGLMPSDQPVKKTSIRQQEGEEAMMKDGFFSPANVGVSPY